MRTPSTRGRDERVWRPVVVGVLAYGVLFSILSLWIRGTFRWGEHAEAYLGELALGLSTYAILTGVHALLAVLLVFEVPRAWRAAPSARKGQVAGVVGALGLVALLQLGAEGLRRMGERELAMVAAPSLAELHGEPVALEGWIHDGRDAWRLRVDRDGRGTFGRVRGEPAARWALTPEDLARLREVLAGERITDLEATPSLLADVAPAGGHRVLTVEVGVRRRGTVVIAPGGSSPYVEPVPPVRADDATLRRVLATWVEVLRPVDHPLARELRDADALRLRELGGR